MQPTCHTALVMSAQEAYDSGLGVESLSLETLNGVSSSDATVSTNMTFLFSCNGRLRSATPSALATACM
jgi:hypothetical protein